MGKLSIFSELAEAILQRKKYWLIPLVAVLVLLGFIMVFAQGSAVAPFIYTLF